MTVNQMVDVAAKEFENMFSEWRPVVTETETETLEQEQDCKELAEYFKRLDDEALKLQMEHDAKYYQNDPKM